jgi:hypothetical protein
VNLVLHGVLTIERLKLVKIGSATSKLEGRYAIDLQLKNNTPAAAAILIPIGQVFENVDPGSKYQNLVTRDETHTSLQPYGSRDVLLPALCLNHGFHEPHGQAGNATPLKIRFSFKDQNALWDAVSEIVRGAH